MNYLYLYKNIEITPTCWLWRGQLKRGKYHYPLHTASTAGQKRTYLVHRLVYSLIYGDIPDGLTLDHLCRVKNCVNPRHLEPVTHRENCARRPPAFKSHCKRGHDLSEHGRPDSRGWGRYCLPCKKAKARMYYLAQKGAA